MRWFFGTLVALLIFLGLYVGSAIASLGGLVGAVQAGNGADVLARTDTARLRRSLVDQIVGAYLKQIGRDRPVKPLERPFWMPRCWSPFVKRIRRRRQLRRKTGQREPRGPASQPPDAT